MRYLASHFHWTAGVLVGVLALLPAHAELGLPNRVLITDDGRGPIWSPDGTKIAFQSDRERVGGRWDIWIVNADGTNPQNLTQNPVIDDMYPVWSPDGTRIAFQSSRDGLSIRDTDIWLMDADGTNPQNLTQTSGIGDTRPVWSPDGTRIAFQSDDDAIWVLELESVPTGVSPATWGTVKRTVFE